MLPFMGSDSRYSLTAGAVHTLPLGRRVGVVSINPREVMMAFVGTDPTWTGGVAIVPGDTIIRGGLSMTLVLVGKNRTGRAVAEFEVVLACPESVQAAPVVGQPSSAVTQESPA